jgi:hypothetical protein
MNQNDYYDLGFFQSNASDDIMKLLWSEVYLTEWMNDSEEGIYKQIPSWYKKKNKYALKKDGSNRSEYERLIGKEIFENTPSTLIEIGNKLIENDQFDFFRTYYKSHELKYIDLWNGSESIDYHFDTINGCDTLILIYLTDSEKWSSEWGGSITMKKQVGNLCHYEQKILPDNATMLVINNANPLVMHKVEKLHNTSINRYTFSFIYKWF